MRLSCRIRGLESSVPALAQLELRRCRVYIRMRYLPLRDPRVWRGRRHGHAFRVEIDMRHFSTDTTRSSLAFPVRCGGHSSRRRVATHGDWHERHERCAEDQPLQPYTAPNRAPKNAPPPLRSTPCPPHDPPGGVEAGTHLACPCAPPRLHARDRRAALAASRTTVRPKYEAPQTYKVYFIFFHQKRKNSW